jgi:hypothetical protein
VRRQTPRRERVVPSKETPKRPKLPLCRSQKPQQREQPIQLPPLSSPKGGPQRAMLDVTIATFPLHTPLRRRKSTPCHTMRCGNLARLSPKIWWIIGKASNPQTPKGACCKTTGLLSQNQHRRNTTRVLLQNIGYCLPVQVYRSRRAHLSTQTSVNVARR